MQSSDFDFGLTNFDDGDLEFDYSTPRPEILCASQPQDGSAIPGSSDGEPSPASFVYTIDWKLQLRKGRTTTLTQVTVENIEDLPSVHWEERLKFEIADLVKSKLPKPQYQLEEVNFILITSKRGVGKFRSRSDSIDINWTTVENKLKSWANEEDKLIVEIYFVYKESQATAAEQARRGRGATRRHLAARDLLVAQQEAAGTPPVWKGVYKLFECSSVACPNRGFNCLRDPINGQHRKLDSDIMDKLIRYAEEGNRLERHEDVPEDLRELIRRRVEEEETRKRRKRKASDLQPIIQVCCGHHDAGTIGCAGGPGGSARQGQPTNLKIPMPKDKAPGAYTSFLCTDIEDETWLESYWLACRITLEKGYDLLRLYSVQDEGARMLCAHGVLEGIAFQFVSRVKEWLDGISKD